MKTCDCSPNHYIEYKLQDGRYIHMPNDPALATPHIFDAATGSKTELTMQEAFKIR